MKFTILPNDLREMLAKAEKAVETESFEEAATLFVALADSLSLFQGRERDPARREAMRALVVRFRDLATDFKGLAES